MQPPAAMQLCPFPVQPSTAPGHPWDPAVVPPAPCTCCESEQRSTELNYYSVHTACSAAIYFHDGRFDSIPFFLLLEELAVKLHLLIHTPALGMLVDEKHDPAM